MPTGQLFRVFESGAPISFARSFDLLENDEAFGHWYSNTLAAAPFEAFFWENPPLTRSSIGRDAEFVLIDAPALAKGVADPTPFRDHFDRDPEPAVLTFSNPGGDAFLIVPRPVGAASAYAHLGQFVRNAPRGQVAALWSAVGRSLRTRVDDRPRWLSTAGLGVYWLHLRLGTRPKYYQFAAYELNGPPPDRAGESR
jgi:hypothetical protein